MPLVSRDRIGPTLRPEDVGLSEARYAFFLEHLFGRIVGDDEDFLDLLPLISDIEPPVLIVEPQAATILAFSRSKHDLVGRERTALHMGLHALNDTMFSDFALAFVEADRDLVLPYLWSMKVLWRDLFATVAIREDFHPQLGSGGDNLVHLAFMWFDVWLPPKVLETDAACREALWEILCEMLDSGNRVCEGAGWHGINHLRLESLVDATRISEKLSEYLNRCAPGDPMRRYAEICANSRAL